MICDFGLGTTLHPLAVDRKIVGDLLAETHRRAQGHACGLQGLGRVSARPAADDKRSPRIVQGVDPPGVPQDSRGVPGWRSLAGGRGRPRVRCAPVEGIGRLRSSWFGRTSAASVHPVRSIPTTNMRQFC